MDSIIVDFTIVDAVTNSWLTISRIPNYEQVAGEILFRKIFELAPVALGMYPFGEEFKGREDELYQSEIFQRHAKGVVRMLDEVVNMLGPDMEIVTKVLTDLGARHVAYGVVPAHYGIVGEALLHTLATALGKDGWTNNVKKGWTAVYGFVSTAMIEGANRQIQKVAARRRERLRKKITDVKGQPPAEAEGTQKLVSDPPKQVSIRTKISNVPGLRKLKETGSIDDKASLLSDKKAVASLIDDVLNISMSSGASIGSESTPECSDPTTTDGDSTTGSSPSSYFMVVENVYRSWDIIKGIPDYEKVAGVLLFKKIFEIAPAAKGLYSFYDSDSPDMQGEAFYEHPAFVRHAVGVVRMLDAAVHMLGPDLELVTETLEGLGARHVKYGVISDHYPIVGEALLSTLEAALGDAWTDDVKLGWTTIFSFVSSAMQKGAAASEEDERVSLSSRSIKNGAAAPVRI